MTYAIISLGGKQYRVSEGQRLLVDRLRDEEGATLSPTVLMVGGDGGAVISPSGVTVKAKVLEHRRGPKIMIGKHRQRTGYRRRTGFRAALTQIEIEAIGGASGRHAPAREAEQATPEQKPKTKAAGATTPEPAGALPDGYADMTVAAIKDAVGSWELPAVEAALVFEREHAQRKGAVAALESALEQGKEG